MTSNAPHDWSPPKQIGKTRASVGSLNKIVMRLYNEKDGVKNNETIEELLLSENEVYGSLLEERLVHFDQGAWKLTPKGRALADASQMIRKSRRYIMLIPAVCLLSILLTVISLIY
jgi:predicted methyltransferase